MVKKKPAAQAKTAENETVKVETKAAEKTTAAEKEAVKEVAKEVVKETAAYYVINDDVTGSIDL